jgi:ParB family chromosome partitioning protein
MASSVRNRRLTSVDDLFSSEESRQAEQQQQGEQVLNVPISEVYDFADNPYHVRQDAELMDMVDSIKRIGVHTPCIARPRPDGGYELLSGHRRKLASTLAGRDTLPLIVRDIDDDSAIIMVVDGNIQRETITFSEKAKAYRMKLEALKRQAGRPSQNYSQVGNNFGTKTSVEEMAKEKGESKNQIYRYIRLTELAPPLLEMVDDKKIAFTPAVELSYLPQELQTELMDVIEQNECTPSLSQAQRLKQAAQEGKLDRNGIELVMSEEKPQQNNVTIKGSRLEKYFPKEYTPKQKEDIIIKALDLYYKKLERARQEKEYER